MVMWKYCCMVYVVLNFFIHNLFVCNKVFKKKLLLLLLLKAFFEPCCTISLHFRRYNSHTCHGCEHHFIWGPLYRKFGETLVVNILDLQNYVLRIMSSSFSIYLDQ